ncbi:uncharacterized protein HRG_02619 [Hirsutella rhossiliensis]|uniref:Uncharacterized protein n=1 Tax=Hirsutella rhossiliensis TaxID=111463 RepID=A0A9P8N5G8_9HYPO|nr:uncharacterized protein HRG_02619 [Hirsutella rhossiliensis]KAH0967210.1 hypothetical protein HRG_02619 [Hirsutella rhossiliensis]
MCKLLVLEKACSSQECGNSYRDSRIDLCQEALDLVGMPDLCDPPQDDALAHRLRMGGHEVVELRDESVPLHCNRCLVMSGLRKSRVPACGSR